MNHLRIRITVILLLAIGLAGCRAERSSAPPPAATSTTTSFVTDTDQATVEAVTVVPTSTFTPSPQPTPTQTPLPPTATATSSPTPEPEPRLRVNETLSTSVNVRAGPGTSYPVVTQFEPGQEAIIVGRNADDSWWQVSLVEAAEEESVGWIFGELISLLGDDRPIQVVEAAPPSPTATPDAVTQQAEAALAPENEGGPQSSQELEEQLRCGKDFCVTYQAMVPIWENGGCIGNHSIYITVLEGPPPGRPLDGVVIGDTFGNVEVASGDKGPGAAEITLWMNSMSVKAKRHVDGAPYTSEESFSFTAHDELIPAEVLAAAGYCGGNAEECRVRQNQNQICRGHYSWKVTFHKFD